MKIIEVRLLGLEEMILRGMSWGQLLMAARFPYITAQTD